MTVNNLFQISKLFLKKEACSTKAIFYNSKSLLHYIISQNDNAIFYGTHLGVFVKLLKFDM